MPIHFQGDLLQESCGLKRAVKRLRAWMLKCIDYEMKLPNGLTQYAAYFAVIAICAKAYGLQSNANPFAFFEPSVTITSEERAQLDRGEPIAHILKSSGNELGLVAAIPVNADGDRLTEWVNQIEEWKKNPHILAVGRFSNPPQLEDLERLVLDEHDVEDIRTCRTGHCDLKLSTQEMTRLQKATEQGDGASIEQEFRQMILDRVQNYLKTGQIPPDDDHHKQVQPAMRFDSLLRLDPYLTKLPQLAEVLQGHIAANASGVDTFFYWSKEHLARKAVVSVTQVSIVRNQAADLPEALAVGKDIFSSHYLNASLSVTALMRGEPAGMNYLVYINRTDVDVLHGVFGGIIRSEIEKHMKDTSDVMTDFRKRLESGPPPQLQSSTSGR